MAYFLDISIKKGFLDSCLFLSDYNYYLNNESKILVTVYFEEDELLKMRQFVNKIILVREFRIQTFYTDMGHFLFCTKEYETKEIDFVNFKNIILKNILSQTPEIQSIIRKIDKKNRFVF